MLGGVLPLTTGMDGGRGGGGSATDVSVVVIAAAAVAVVVAVAVATEDRTTWLRVSVPEPAQTPAAC